MFGGYHGLLQQFPCREALGSFLCCQISGLVADLLELESLQLLQGGASCRNGYQPDQQVRLACGPIALRRPRLRGASRPPGGFLRLLRSRQSFHQAPSLFLLGLARHDLSGLGQLLQVEPDLWAAAENRLWQRLEQWRCQNLASLAQHCLVLEELEFGPDNPQLLVALVIDRQGLSQVVDARPGEAASTQGWWNLCEGLKQRSIPSPILVKGAPDATRLHWPGATALEV